MAFLKNSDVIFYHPLDDYEEFTANQIWDGSGTFVPGQIGSGNSAIATKALNFGNTFIHSDEGALCYFPTKHGMANIDDTHIITTWSSGNYIRTRVLETSGISIVGSGDAVIIDERFPHAEHFWSIVHLASGECIIPYFDNSPFEKRCVRLSVSGVTITVKNNIVLSNCGIGSWITRIDDTRAIIAHYYYPGTPSVVCQIISLDGVNDLIAGDQAIATTLNMSNAPWVDVACLSPSSLVVGYVNANDPAPHEGYVCPGTISGTTITFPSGDYGGSGYLVHDDCEAVGDKDGTALHMTAISGNHFVVSYIAGNIGDDNYAFSKVGTISGSNIILGDKYPWPTGDCGPAFYVAVDRLNDDNVFVFCGRCTTPSDITATVGIVDPENRTIDFGTLQNCGFDKEVSKPTVVRLSDDKVFIIANDCIIENKSDGVIASIDHNAFMISPSDVYPAVSGQGHVAVGMWAKNPILSPTEIIIKRSYEISLTSDSISFGSGTAIWNSSGIINLIDSLNNDVNHLTILDFYNTSGDNWQLRTSVDGSGFVDRGEQDSGSQTKDLVKTTPALYINDGHIGTQWIDELIMWGGDFEYFTNEELENLYILGVSGYTMDQYGDIFPGNQQTSSASLFIRGYNNITTSGDLFIQGYGVPQQSCDLFIAGSYPYNMIDLYIMGPLISSASGDLFIHGYEIKNITTSGDLFITGFIPSINESRNLFIYGHNTPHLYIAGCGDISGIPAPSLFIYGRSPISEIPLRIIHRLTRTGDYHPQLIGSFDPYLSFVNIQVWDVVDGVNVPVAITSSGCSEIGDIGKWRWSTEHLPFASGYHNYHYYFKMISHTHDTYYGEFFLTVPERGRWVYP